MIHNLTDKQLQALRWIMKRKGLVLNLASNLIGYLAIRQIGRFICYFICIGKIGLVISHQSLKNCDRELIGRYILAIKRPITDD